MCGMKAGCETFVFEPLSATCVLLPPVADAKVLSSHNEYTVAGTLQITLVASGGQAASTEHGDCQYQASSGYAGGQLGPAEPLPGGEPVATKMDCCDACDRDPKCSKVTGDERLACTHPPLLCTSLPSATRE